MGYYEPVFPTMPFGKHTGTMVDKLPESYLRWMAKSMSDPFLRVCAAAALAGKPCPEPEDCVFLDVADSGAIILIDAPYELKEDIKMLSERGWDADRKKWWIPIHGFEELMDEFPAAHPSAALKKMIGVSAERQDLLEAINLDAGEGDIVDVGDGLKLYPYQATAIRFLDATDGKCLIADEQGTGKTIEALAWLRAHPENRPVLIVCPATVKGMWAKEVAKWLGDTNPIILKSKDTYAFDPTRSIVIANYDIMDVWKDDLMYHRYNTIIVDESHFIKSEKAKRSKAVVALAHKSKHRILLTGTPAVNRPIELFNQLNAIDPITWSSFFNFGKRYCLLPEAPILMSDFTERPMKDIRIGDKVIGWSKRSGRRGRSTKDANRLLCETTVLDVMEFESPIQKVVLTNDDVVFCTPDHKWFTGYAKATGSEYANVRNTKVGTVKPMHLIRLPFGIEPIYPIDDKRYMLGYIIGFFMGDGWCTKASGTSTYNLFKDVYTPSIRKRPRDTCHIGCACVDPEPIDRLRAYFSALQTECRYRVNSEDLFHIDVANPLTNGYAFIETAVKNTDNWNDPVFCGGFLGGIYDAEGSYNTIAQYKAVNPITYEHIEQCLKIHKIPYTPCSDVIRILGGRGGMINFWNISNPSLKRKINTFLSYKCGNITSDKVPIDHIEPVDGVHKVMNIMTETGNYIAYGYGSKNCGAHQEWISDEKQVWMFDGATNLDELSERLKSTIMLRRTKEQVLPDLPDKSRQVIDVEIDNRKAYTTLIDNMDDSNQLPIAIFTELLMTMMRGKIKPSIRYIDDVMHDVDKLVVFCTHTEMIDALETKFADRGVAKIDGSVPVQKRTDIIEQFQTDPDTQLFLGNVQAAGMGITLTAASHSIFTELPWGPTILEQAEDRLHRISQENAVNIYILNAIATVDAHITDLIVHKKQIINNINNDMTMDDLREFTKGGDPWAI